MDRRHFLASAMGMTTSLWVLNYVAACSSSSGSPSGVGKKPVGSTDAGGGDADSGHFCVPKESMFDPQWREHGCRRRPVHLRRADALVQRARSGELPGVTQAFGGLFAIATEDNYINTFLLQQRRQHGRAHLVAGSAAPATRKLGCGYPLSNDHMAASRDKINALAGNSQRAVSHVR